MAKHGSGGVVGQFEFLCVLCGLYSRT